MPRAKTTKMQVTLDPIEITIDDAGDMIERIRERAHPRLVVTVEGDGPLEIITIINEINDALGDIAYGNERLPMPDLECPTCHTKLR